MCELEAPLALERGPSTGAGREPSPRCLRGLGNLKPRQAGLERFFKAQLKRTSSARPSPISSPRSRCPLGWPAPGPRAICSSALGFSLPCPRQHRGGDRRGGGNGARKGWEGTAWGPGGATLFPAVRSMRPVSPQTLSPNPLQLRVLLRPSQYRPHTETLSCCTVSPKEVRPRPHPQPL